MVKISPLILTLIALCSFPAFSQGLSVEAVNAERGQAEEGDKVAQYNIGVMNYVGTDMPKNDIEAVKWFSKSAEQNYAPAQNILGIMYYKGDGVAKDEVEGLKLIRKAAEQGFPDAIHILDAAKESPQIEQQKQNVDMAIGKMVTWVILIIIIGLAVRHKRKGKDQHSIEKL